MSSNISNRSGQDEAFTAIKPAWHGLGKTLDHIATAKEALEAANLGWEVKTEPIYLRNESEAINTENKLEKMALKLSTHEIKDRFAIVRHFLLLCLFVFVYFKLNW